MSLRRGRLGIRLGRDIMLVWLLRFGSDLLDLMLLLCRGRERLVAMNDLLLILGFLDGSCYILLLF